MSRRRRDDLYAGAKGRKTLADALRAGRRHVVAPKVDGTYTVATTDKAGYLANMITRNGQSLPDDFIAAFRGVRWAPNAVLVGEAECWTERSIRVATTRGYPLLHLFDVLRLDGRDVSSLPYQDRRDALMRAESAPVNESLDRPWTEDDAGRVHDRAGRFTRPVPMSWRRMPVVPQRPASEAENAWSDWVDGGEAEGLVLIDPAAPLGRGKGKIKSLSTAGHDSLDVTVRRVGELGVWVDWNNYQWRIRCAGWVNRLRPGMVVEVAHAGWLEHRVAPKHPRVVRIREDLTAGVNDGPLHPR